jgi:hypothetical protein
MRLSLEDGTTLMDPTAAQIADALRTLNWLEDNSFAILEKSDDSTYLQTAQMDEPDLKEPRFVLEYQDVSLARHYEAVAEDGIALEKVIAGFQQYATGSESWRDGFEWKKMDL